MRNTPHGKGITEKSEQKMVDYSMVDHSNCRYSESYA